MRVGRSLKDPDSISIHTIDWSKWLTARGADTISSSSWSIPAAIGPEVSETNDTTTATVTLPAKGTVGDTHEIVNSITTAGGLAEDAVLLICITED